MNFSRILSISRPHFWLYEFGTFVIGVLIGFLTIGINFSPELIVFGLYFLIPANILIYGINDVHDYETDMKNPKKIEYEDVLMPEHHKSVQLWILATNIPFIVYGIFISPQAFIALLLFVFFAYFYSSPPIRAKARPGFDSLFSGSHYVMTGVFGYLLVVNDWSLVNWILVGSALLWTFAMHAYSAVPDIQADREAGVPTVATLLEKKKTLLLCLVLYVLAFVGGALYSSWLFMILGIPYVFLVLKSLKTTDAQLFKLYKYFPYLNAFVGAVVTIYILYRLM